MSGYIFTYEILVQACNCSEKFKLNCLERISSVKINTMRALTMYSNSYASLNKCNFDRLEKIFKEIENIIITRVTSEKYRELIYENRLEAWENRILQALDRSLIDASTKVLAA